MSQSSGAANAQIKVRPGCGISILLRRFAESCALQLTESDALYVTDVSFQANFAEINRIPAFTRSRFFLDAGKDRPQIRCVLAQLLRGSRRSGWNPIASRVASTDGAEKKRGYMTAHTTFRGQR